MNTSWIWAFAVFACVLSSAKGSERLESTIKCIDTSLERVDVEKLTPRLAPLLSLTEAELSQALKRHSFSSVAFARFVAIKTTSSVEKVLGEDAFNKELGEYLDEKTLDADEAAEFLEKVQTELAFLLLDYKGKRKKIR